MNYYFLGAGHNALALFAEIIIRSESQPCTLHIIRNQPQQDAFPFIPPGANCVEVALSSFKKREHFPYVIGVNLPQNKKTVYDYFKDEFGIDFSDYKTITDPHTTVASSAILKNGVVLNPGVVVAPFARLGNLVTVNRNASIGHHTVIGDFCTIQPGANIAGHCVLEECVTIGMGVNIIEKLHVGKNTVIGAGSLVTQDIPENVVAYGIPAKVVRKN